MKINRCVIIQGPTNPTYKKSIQYAWGDIPIIWSCYKGEENYYDINDVTIFNETTKNSNQHHNLEFQRRTTLNGLIKAKELGYNRVLKWRSDMKPSNSYQFIKLLDNIKLNIHSYHDHQKGYLLDFFIEGGVDDLIRLFAFPMGRYAYPEEAITEQFMANGFKYRTNCIKNQLTIDNDIIWYKRGTHFYNMKTQPKYVDRLPSRWRTNKSLLHNIDFKFKLNGKEAKIKTNVFMDNVNK